MKQLIVFAFCSILLEILLSSCATGENVVSGNGLFQKRKHNKGWHLKKSPSPNEIASKKTNRKEVEFNNKIVVANQKNEQDIADANINYNIESTPVNKAINTELVQAVEAFTKKSSKGKNTKITNNENLVAESSPIELDNQLINNVNMKKDFRKLSVNKGDQNKGSDDTMFLLLLILCFIVPPLAVYLITEDLMQTLLNVLLMLLFFIPAVIHALIVLFRNR